MNKTIKRYEVIKYRINNLIMKSFDGENRDDRENGGEK